MFMKSHRQLAVFILASQIGAFSLAEETTLVPIMDASVSEASPTNNYATSDLVVGRLSGSAWESYLRFDLSEIPVNAEITAAEIRFEGSDLSSGGTIDLSVPLATWIEGMITWQNRPSSSSLGLEVLTVDAPNTVHLDLEGNGLSYLQNVVRNAVPDRGLKLSLDGADADDALVIESRTSTDGPRLLVTYTLGEALPDFAAGLGDEQEQFRAKLFQAPEAAVADFELVWSTKPGLRYQLWDSTDLEQWNLVDGYPTEAEALSDLYEIQAGPVSKFYRVEVLDEQGPEIGDHFPADGTFGIRRFYPSRSEIGLQLSDASGIDPDSVNLNLGARGTFTLTSPELTLQNGVLSFETGADTALGTFGETVTATLNVADTLGQPTVYTWSFEMEEEVVLVDNLVIFGSVEAQRSGQRVPYTPTRALAGNPGPIRADDDGWEIKEVTADSVTIAYEASAPAFTVGQYLSNRTPRSVDEIFYRKVISLNDDGAQKELTIFTEDVPAWEIMEGGTVSLNGDELAYEMDEVGNIIAARALKTFETSGEFQVDPVEINWSGKELAGFYTKPDNTTGMEMAGFHPNENTGVIDFGLEGEAPGGAAWEGKLKLKQGRLTATPTISLAVKMSWLKGLEKFYAESELRVDAVVEPEFEFFSAELAGASVKKTLWRHDFIIPIGGPLPIWVTVTPRINGRASFSAGLSGSISVGAQGGFTNTTILDYEKEREPRLEYDSKFGNPSFELLDPEIRLTGQIGASATLEPEVEVKLLSMVGFYVNVDPTVYADVSAELSTGTLLSAEASVGIRTNLNVGMSITAVDDSLLPAYQRELFDYGWSWNFPEALPEAPLAILIQPQSTTVTSGETLRLTVATNHTSGVNYKWRKDGRRLLDFGPELVRHGVGNEAAGDYQVIVSYAGDEVESDVATVSLGGGGPAPSGFVFIPSGSFQMGDGFGDGNDYESPVHSVYVSAFYMGEYEVTKALWDDVRAWGLNNGYTDLPVGGGKGANHPVHTVTWYAIVKWCNARSQKEGLQPCYTVDGATYKVGNSAPECNWNASGYRLPSEAEWEKAARGGFSGKRFPWGDTITHSQANYRSLNIYSYDVSPTREYHPTYNAGAHPYTSPVGSFAANSYGLYDMAGNAYEWCWDWFSSDYYETSLGTDPHGPESGSDRSFRSGGWAGHARSARCGYRNRFGPGAAYNYLGFRLARGQ